MRWWGGLGDALARDYRGFPCENGMRLTRSGGRLWVVVALVLAVSLVVPAVSVVAQGGFSDLDEAGPHRVGVEGLAEMGVLEGTDCAPGEFCPGDALQRWVMAVWLVRVLDGTDPVLSDTRFADVDSDEWWAPYVERLAVLGVTAGCATGPARYCPTDSVTRAQMATFLTRAFDLEPAPSFGFVDVDGNTHAGSIDALAGAGVTAGCASGPARYCPGDSVTRAQMATFLTRAINRAALSVGLESSTGRTVAGSFQVGVSFARPVTGFGLDDVKVVNGRATSLAGLGSDYEVTIVPAAEGTVVVRIPEGAARDTAGSPNQASGLLVRTFGSDGHRDGPGFDVWDRDVVVSAYLAEFEREQPDPGFTGNVADCDAGTTSQAFRDSVVQRVNWYRQMAGLDTVTERAEYSDAAQQAALMMSAQRGLSHYPGTDWACYTETGALGARSSNLGLGHSGAYGIDRYMRDTGDNNRAVGHRRWILYPQLLQIGTGNIPYASSHRGANALYVVGDRHQGDVREQRGFVAWPPAGYAPAETVWGRWSFQLPGVDFGSATVTVADDYGPIPVAVTSRGTAIVWAVHGDWNSEKLPGFPDRDYCYTVTISNVRAGGTTQVPFQYFTCLLDLASGTGGIWPVFLAWSPDSAQIVYRHDGGVWTVNADGTRQRLILLSGSPRWSPDRTRIAYGNNGIWVMNADGTNQQQLTESGSSPVWSPDGTKIAYRGSGMWTVNADGTNQQQLTDQGAPYPVWSPDGTKIAYGRYQKGVWTVNPDGTGNQQLTTQGYNPVWSPDGTRIVYATNYEIWTINADGTNQQSLAKGIDTWKVSPDRTRIVFSSYSPSDSSSSSPSDWGIWIMNTDGTNHKRLTTNRASHLTWSPDGTQIAYSRFQKGVWTINTDGTNHKQHTTHGGNPVWSPDGTQIAYDNGNNGIWVMNTDGTNQHQLTN